MTTSSPETLPAGYYIFTYPSEGIATIAFARTPNLACQHAALLQISGVTPHIRDTNGQPLR